MADLSDLAKAIAGIGGEKSTFSNIASALGQIGPGKSYDYKDYSLGENAAAAIGLNLISGLFGGIGARREAEQKALATDVLSKAMLGEEVTRPEGMWNSVFSSIQEPVGLFKVQNQLEETAADRALQKQKDLLEFEYNLKKVDPAVELQQKINEARELKRAEIEGENLGYSIGGGVNPDNPVEKKASELRKDFNAREEVQNYKYVSRLSDQLAATLENPSAVSDPLLAKMLVQLVEPKLAVNQGEAAGLAASKSIPQNLKGTIEQALTGKSQFTEPIRAEILKLAKTAFEAHKELYDTTFTEFSREAKRYKIDPARLTAMGNKSFDDLVKQKLQDDVRQKATPTGRTVNGKPTYMIDGVEGFLEEY